MEVKELRVGNYACWDMNDPKQDNEPEQGYIDVRVKIWHLEDAERLSPIPLTEELALKFGAKKLDTITYPHNMQRYCISDSKNNSFIFTIGSNGFECSQSFILNKYVHQFQNIFYTATGDELEFKHHL